MEQEVESEGGKDRDEQKRVMDVGLKAWFFTTLHSAVVLTRHSAPPRTGVAQTSP